MDHTPLQFHAVWVRFCADVLGKSASYACRVSKSAGIQLRKSGGGRKPSTLADRILAKVGEVTPRDGESLSKRDMERIMKRIAEFSA
jgi:hypothetical protein